MSIADRAREEAFSAYPWDIDTAIRFGDRERIAFRRGAQWSVEQEPTDEEVGYVMVALGHDPGADDRETCERLERQARAAISAFLAARRK